jgi:AmiR/NasT family two-component response regulator
VVEPAQKNTHKHTGEKCSTCGAKKRQQTEPSPAQLEARKIFTDRAKAAKGLMANEPGLSYREAFKRVGTVH